MGKRVLRACLLLLLLGNLHRPGHAEADEPSQSTPQEIYWYEGATRKQAWLAQDEFALFPAKPAQSRETAAMLIDDIEAGATILDSSRFLIHARAPRRMSLTQIKDMLRSAERSALTKRAAPVYYGSRDRDTYSRLIPTGEIIVRFDPSLNGVQIAALEKEYGLGRIKTFPFAPGTYLYSADAALESVSLANQLVETESVIFAYPNWLRKRSLRAVPDDPLFPDQWHLENTGLKQGTAGEDVNILSVWDTYRGTTDEVVAVVDDGLEIGHEDLAPNILAGQSWDYLDDNNDPTGGEHGTSVAGVVAARGFNALGVSGVAPLAGMVGYRLLGAETDANEADALTRNAELVDIYSNSWGPFDDGARLEGPGPLTESALQNAVTSGRGGLGSIYVWAGGNGYDDDNSNYDGYANLRYTIAVAASNNRGVRPNYSEKGANILINAPSNGGTLGITTTDRTGSQGYDRTNYTDDFGGTSSAAPLVAGVIALMLQANPGLTWREVQHILIQTAEKNDPQDSDWNTNAAGYPINHKYGFGRIDAQAAVAKAENWPGTGTEAQAEATSSPGLPIPDNNPEGVGDTLTLSTDLQVESVEVIFNAADHSYWGDLQITLVSPGGTESILAEVHNGGRSHTYRDWRFGTVRPFGETANGSWTLTVRDLWAEDLGTFQSWTLKVYGTRIGMPAVTIASASKVTARSATLNGTINTEGIPTTYYFEYGTTTAYGSVTPQLDAVVGSQPSEVSAQLTGLLPGTSYHFRLVAGNAGGRVNGTDMTFTTDTLAEGKTQPWLQLLLDEEPTAGRSPTH